MGAKVSPDSALCRGKAPEADSGIICAQIEAVVHDTEKGLSVDSIAQKRGLDPTIVEQIVRDQVKAAEAFHDGLIQGMEDENEKYRGGTDH